MYSSKYQPLFLCFIFAFFSQLQKGKCHSDFQKDSTQIYSLLKCARQHSLTDFPNAILEIKNALTIAQKLNDNKILFTVYRNTGDVYENNCRLKEAYTFYEKALNLQDFISIGKKLDIYLDWAIINKKLFNYTVSRDYYNKILDLANSSNDLEMVQYAYSGLGSLNASLSDYDVAINFHLKANEIAVTRKDTGSIISTQVNIATIHIQTGSFHLAYNTLEKAFKMASTSKDSIRMGCILNGYGKVYNAEKQYQKAITHHQNALTFFNNAANKRMISETLGFLADVYTQAGQYTEAEKTFKQCFEYKDFFEFYEHPNLYLKVGNLYLKTQKPARAKAMFNESLDLATNRGFKDIIQKSYWGLAEVSEQSGDYKNTVKFIKISKTYEDSLATDDKIKRVAEAEYKYDMGKAESEYKLNMAERQKEIHILQYRQNRIVVALLSILLLGGILFFYYYARQKAKSNLVLSQKNTEIKLKNDRLEKSNEILQQFAYASAHDLKEPLRSISGFVSIIDKKYAKLLPPEASDYMKFVTVGVKRMESLIAALLEYSTVAADSEDIHKATSLLDILEDVKDNLHGVIVEKNALITSKGFLPALKISRLHQTQLLQNLIGNAVKFSDKTPVIKISGKTETDQFILEIKDNGIGMKQEYSDKIFKLFQRLSRSNQYGGTGIGLAICKQIVDKYDGTIRFESIENVGTTFFLSFPIHLIETSTPVKNAELVEQLA
jgi:signal transduction histidine kinase/lipopolysaccharide biosynthesis regulator YciM